MNYLTKLSQILEVPADNLKKWGKIMEEKTGQKDVLEKIAQENEGFIEKALKEAGITKQSAEATSDVAEAVRDGLFTQIKKNEQELYDYIGISPEVLDFEKIAELARKITTESQGFFLKWEFAEEILKKRPPGATMKYLGYSSVEEMLKNEDIGEIFSALRFTETNEWMHETFDKAYMGFTEGNFEERPIKLSVLSDRWIDIAKKYIAKKHHNVSHLKEFGIIFLNPVAETEPGKFLRDFALLLHYFHEISFYSKLFRKYSTQPNFNEQFISLLRSDVPELSTLNSKLSTGMQWLIIQRYLWKDDPKDPRLFIPRVNLEALHWEKAEQDLVQFGKENGQISLEFWEGLSSVAGIFSDKNEKPQLISLDLEDNAMGVASASDKKEEYFFYHQREALWNKIFVEYVGGYDELERLVIENMDRQYIEISRNK